MSSQPHPRTATAPQLRLTRRGRLVLVALVAALAFALISLGQVAAQAGDGSGDAVSSTTWVVQPGETLWVIAERVDPGTDPRETVARIVAMNDLPGSSVLVGQELQVPA
jgi:nucleoid-associated protein YgaU